MFCFDDACIRHGRYVCGVDPRRRRILVSVGNAVESGVCVEFLTSVTYPRPDVRRGKVELPDGITFDMLTIPIVSEAVQVEGIDVGGATGGGCWHTRHSKL